MEKIRTALHLVPRTCAPRVYSAVKTEDGSSDGLLYDSEGGNAQASQAIRDTILRKRRPQDLCTSVTILALTCVCVALAFGYKRVSDLQCTVQTSGWSPMNPAVEYEEKDFDNAFAHDTIYRGPPTPELEKAWEELWFFGGVRIPEDKLPLINRTVDMGNGRTLKPVEDEQGGYHSLFEVFHQLHCLNLIRQYTWRDWYFRHPDRVETPTDMRASDVGVRMHVDHCIEALRISLMCHGDTTPFLIMLDPKAPQGSKADFSPHHKCRKFEPLREWVKKNQLSRPVRHHGHGTG